MKILNTRGANLWLRNARGDLPVHEAAASGRIELVEWLLKQKPNHINSSSNDGRTILHIAAGNDNVNMCKNLIELGADVNAVYRNAKNVVKTPLDCALQKGFRTTAKFIQSHEGLPANKLRLSGSRKTTHSILPELDEVKPLKFTEIEVSYEAKGRRKSKESESDSEAEGRHRRKKHRRCSHKRRTSSCSETFICHRVDEPCEIGRSKSSSELHRHRKSKHSSSSECDSSQSESSGEECCYHIKRKHRCYKKVKDKSNERDGSRKRQACDKKGSESSECKENGDKDARSKKDKKKVEIASSAKKNDNKALTSSKTKGDQKATKAPLSANKKRPPSAKPTLQKKLSQEEKQKSIDKPKTPEIPDEPSIDVSKKSTTTPEEVSEDDKSIREITTQAEVHETLQTDVDEGALTDATYTVEKRDKCDLAASTADKAAQCESAVEAPAMSTVEGSKKVSFKNDEAKDDEKCKSKTPEPPVEHEQQQPTEELQKLTAVEKSSSPLPPAPLIEDDYDESPENIQRPKSQTPESVGSFTILEDGDDAEQKLKEFEEMTQDEAFPNMEDDESEQPYFDDSSSMEKLPRHSKIRETFGDEEGFKVLVDESKDQDSGIEPSPRAHRSKIPAPRSSLPARRAFVVTEERSQSTRIEGRKPGDKNAVNMTTVTQSIQKNMRR